MQHVLFIPVLLFRSKRVKLIAAGFVARKACFAYRLMRRSAYLLPLS